MGIFGKTQYEKDYELLNPIEKNIINNTVLSIEDIKYYEDILLRKLTERELTIVSKIRDYGILMNERDLMIYNILSRNAILIDVDDFKKYISN